MPAIRTFTRSVNDFVTVRVPAEYRSRSLEIIVLPVMENESNIAEYTFDNVEAYQANAAEPSRRREAADRAFAYLMAQDDGGIESNWHFDRDEANSR